MLQQNNKNSEIGRSISDLAPVKSNSLNPGLDEETEPAAMRRKDSMNLEVVSTYKIEFVEIVDE